MCGSDGKKENLRYPARNQLRYPARNQLRYPARNQLVKISYNNTQTRVKPQQSVTKIQN